MLPLPFLQLFTNTSLSSSLKSYKNKRLFQIDDRSIAIINLIKQIINSLDNINRWLQYYLKRYEE